MNGWLTPVVNPDSYGAEGSESPEGQAFVVEMHSAWRDWVADGSKGANGAKRSSGSPELLKWSFVFLGVCWGVLV